jgi:lambda repressor-like predicted transcriptional regulator
MTKELTKSDVPKNPAEKQAWVIYQLRIRGWSLRTLGREHGVTGQAMSHALRVSSVALEPIFANELGLTVAELFPERFAANGRRIGYPRDPKPQPKPEQSECQRQKGAAA